MDLDYGRHLYLGQVDVQIVYELTRIPAELGWPYHEINEIGIAEKVWIVQPYMHPRITGVRLDNLVYVFYGENSLPSCTAGMEKFRETSPFDHAH